MLAYLQEVQDRHQRMRTATLRYETETFFIQKDIFSLFFIK